MDEMFVYSNRKTFKTKQSPRKRNVYKQPKSHFVFGGPHFGVGADVSQGGIDESKAAKIVVLSPPVHDNDTNHLHQQCTTYREKRARSVPKQHNPNSLKSKIKMKKPNKHRLNEWTIPSQKPILNPSLSDQTANSKRTSLSQVKLRKRRSFIGNNKVLSIDWEDNPFDHEMPPGKLSLTT